MNSENLSAKEQKVFKVLTLKEWKEASQTGQIATELDQQDGFVHLSSATHIAEGLTYERSDKRGGEFAHFYGELSTQKISQLWQLDRSAFSLPSEVMLQAEQD